MDVKDAKLELLMLEGEVQDLHQIDVVTKMTNQGLSQEIVTRLEELWDYTVMVGDKLVHLGKIIISKILNFVSANVHLALGVALGAAVGSLINIIPFFGQLLAPLSITVGAVIGGVAGTRLDRGQEPGDGVIGLTQEVLLLAGKFYEFFASIINALANELVPAEVR
jgi:hypothetical protein